MTPSLSPGQHHYGLTQEALELLLQLLQVCSDQGQSVADVLKVLMPA